ncbi:MAG: GntR family transcriptional regulator [Prevotella sp.]|jgi:DNA-binding transcriptional regulator YhcF (GntR family)|uniref:GntR family transcriptional regulator n=1 Tax=unclassified Dysgonomonas TaxID=2630389 RepID=UPI0025BC2060|nr:MULTISPECIES: GntR family transcriptional regulator [unclassified Dysgonomonas]MDR1715030.1 GntR family transcriptional regulator [Prevotella sp.]MDR2001543.1 GntR family transcriptional regulator [Prevotella sp.]HMM03116.1 GntR family transcriptional regulator [Dysgonomonas sp.]
MDFKSNKPIYLQIVDFCFQKMLTNEWAEEERVPSVRELGTMLQVNPNTAMRAFEYMQTENIIYSKRGMGYYVAENARKLILNLQKKDFFEEMLPETFKTMELLDISIDEVVDRYNKSKG